MLLVASLKPRFGRASTGQHSCNLILSSECGPKMCGVPNHRRAGRELSPGACPKRAEKFSSIKWSQYSDSSVVGFAKLAHEIAQTLGHSCFGLVYVFYGCPKFLGNILRRPIQQDISLKCPECQAVAGVLPKVIQSDADKLLLPNVLPNRIKYGFDIFTALKRNALKLHRFCRTANRSADSTGFKPPAESSLCRVVGEFTTDGEEACCHVLNDIVDVLLICTTAFGKASNDRAIPGKEFLPSRFAVGRVRRIQSFKNARPCPVITDWIIEAGPILVSVGVIHGNFLYLYNVTRAIADTYFVELVRFIVFRVIIK